MNLQIVYPVELDSGSKDLTNGEASESENDGDGPDQFGDNKIARKPDVPPGFHGDKDVSDHDLYVQEFYLHCFAILQSGKENYIEN